MNDKTDVTLAVAVKPIGAKAQYILYIRKTKGFFFPPLLTVFLCSYIRRALIPP